MKIVSALIAVAIVLAAWLHATRETIAGSRGAAYILVPRRHQVLFCDSYECKRLDMKQGEAWR